MEWMLLRASAHSGRGMHASSSGLVLASTVMLCLAQLLQINIRHGCWMWPDPGKFGHIASQMQPWAFLLPKHQHSLSQAQALQSQALAAPGCAPRGCISPPVNTTLRLVTRLPLRWAAADSQHTSIVCDLRCAATVGSCRLSSLRPPRERLGLHAHWCCLQAVSCKGCSWRLHARQGLHSISRPTCRPFALHIAWNQQVSWSHGVSKHRLTTYPSGQYPKIGLTCEFALAACVGAQVLNCNDGNTIGWAHLLS
jgi:hypothetical protein